MGPEMLIPFIGEGVSLLGRLARFQQLGIETAPLQRMFLLECECNVSLLACLRLDDEDTPQSGPALWRVAASLETGIIEAVLGVGHESSKVFNSLKKIPLLTADPGAPADQEAGTEADAKEFVSVRLRRLYANAFAVKAAARIHLELDDPTVSGMRDLKFKLRLRNLRRTYVEIAHSLREDLGSDAA